MRVITISNQKGGVAKTTTAIALGAALAETGRRGLAIDMDPHSNLTMGLGLHPDKLERSLFHLFPRRTRICREILQELKRAFPLNLFAPVIGIDTRLRESAAAGSPITTFAPETRAAAEYRALAAELVAEEKAKAAQPRLAEVA